MEDKSLDLKLEDFVAGDVVQSADEACKEIVIAYSKLAKYLENSERRYQFVTVRG